MTKTQWCQVTCTPVTVVAASGNNLQQWLPILVIRAELHLEFALLCQKMYCETFQCFNLFNTQLLQIFGIRIIKPIMLYICCLSSCCNMWRFYVVDVMLQSVVQMYSAFQYMAFYLLLYGASCECICSCLTVGGWGCHPHSC